MAAVGTFTPAAGASYVVAGNLRFAAGVVEVTGGKDSIIPTGFHHIYHAQATIKSAVSYGYVMGFTFTSQSNITAPTVSSADDFYVAIWGV